jgi:hypothetical protein
MAGHVLFTTHLLFGTTNYYVVWLPDGWAVVRARMGPEADRSVQFGPYRWVQDGHAAYGVVDPARRRLGELHVYVRPANGARPPRLPSDIRADAVEEPAEVGDADGRVRRGRLAARGRRRELLVLEAWGRCPHTERWVLVQALGGEDLLGAVAEGLPKGRCH